MRRALLLAAVVILLGGRVGVCLEETVEAINPRGEQEVEAITPHGDQAVLEVGDGREQVVEVQEQPTAAEKTASNVGKAVVGVAAAGVSLGAMAAMLLLF